LDSMPSDIEELEETVDRSDGKRGLQSDHLYTLGIAVGVFLLLIVVGGAWWIWSVWGDLAMATKANVVVGIMGAIGTFSLGGITLFTLLQNRRMIREREKEREKPLVKNVLDEVILPSLKAVEHDLSIIRGQARVKDEVPSVNWMDKKGRTSQRDRNLSHVHPDHLLSSNIAARSWFRTNFPDVCEEMEEREEMVDEGYEKGRAIRENLEKQIRNYVEENEITTEIGDYPDGYPIAYGIWAKKDSLNDDQLAEIWEGHREEFLEMRKEVEDDIRELKEMENKRLSHKCSDILDLLGLVNRDLMTEYRISSDELSEEQELY